MTAHELARKLLELPDIEVAVNDELNGIFHEDVLEDPFFCESEHCVIIPVNVDDN